MNIIPKAFWAVLVLLAAPLVAQDRAGARLYTRVDGDVVRVAIQVEFDLGWHFYHTDLGHPEAIGKPTSVSFSGTAIHWSDVRFPEPVKHGQGFDDSNGEEIWIWIHEDDPVLYAAGRIEEGADVDELVVAIDALVCEVQCLPWSVELESRGKGPDSLFKDFPADLVAPALPEGLEASAAKPVVLPADEHDGGHADATLYTRVENGKVRAAIEVDIDFMWHLYHNELGHPDAVGKPTTVALSGAGITWGEVHFPDAEKSEQGFQDDQGEEIWIYQHGGSIVLFAEGVLEGDADGSDVKAEIDGLTCEDGGMCVPYSETIWTRGKGKDALFAGFPSDLEASGSEAEPAPEVAAAGVESTMASTEGGAEEETLETMSLSKFLLLAVMWGLFTLLMPCTYPMIPITISFFTKQADARGGKVLPLSLAYGLGIVLAFVLIGVLVGPIIVRFATHWATNAVIGVAFLYFSFVLFGVVQMNPPRFLMNLAGKASMTGGYLGVFLMGSTLVITSFTCTAPFVGSLLSVGAKNGDVSRVVIGMAVFGLTVAIPFVFLSLVPGRIQSLPKSGMWMNTLKCSLGFVELAASFKFISNVDLKLDWQILSYEVFLFLWCAIFLAMAWYLIAPLSKDPVTLKRRFTGGFAAVFAVYCLYGGIGHKLDPLMMAMAPPYQGGRLMTALYQPTYSWTIVVDDYDEAIRIARAENKLVMVNFTGHL